MHYPSVSIKDWFIAVRPWAFTATIIPILLGVSLAALDGHWDFWLFVLTLCGGLAVHTGTNYHNTYGDYISGVDTVDSAKTCPQLVTGQIAPEAMRKAGWIAFGVAGTIALVLAVLCGWFVLLFAIIGIIGGYAYTMGKSPYKYAGRGTYYVFFLMGPLMVVPSYMIQTGSFAFGPLFASFSVACLVAAILHANDIRDIQYDTEAKIRTAAMGFGRKKAIKFFQQLNFSAFIIAGLSILMGVLPWTSCIVFASFPLLYKELHALHNPAYDLNVLEGWAAKFHFLFGGLIVVGVLLAIILF